MASLQADRERLSPDISEKEFIDLLHRYESLGLISERLGGYAYLWFAEDTQNSEALSLRDRVNQVLTEASNGLLYFTLWFKELEDESATRLIETSGDLRYYLETERRFKPFTLSEAEERIIGLKDVNGIDAMVNLYEMLTNRLEFDLEVDGEHKSLTRDELASYFRHPSSKVRAATYQELNQVYAREAPVLAQIYSHRVRDWQAEGIELRGFESPIAARNVMNDLLDDVVDALLTACRRNVELFQRYFKLKARWLGVDKLRRYDIYAPLAQSQKQFAFEEGLEMVFESFDEFSPLIADSASQVIEEGHLDSELRPGKRGGAFCYSALPSLTPWVMVNYAGKARDVAIMAHELGHAVHSLQAAHHSVLTFRATLPLAETASVFAEMLLTDRLLQDESDPAVQRDLLAHAVDDAYATIIRQAFFTLFERDAHRMIAAGHTAEELADHYMENLREQFGDAVELKDEFRWEWVSIPHLFRAPFYTYAYSFGQLLVLALYQQYRAKGPEFVPQYLKILAYGGSASPAQILDEASIDITTPGFWQGGFEVLNGMIDTLEKL